MSHFWCCPADRRIEEKMCRVWHISRLQYIMKPSLLLQKIRPTISNNPATKTISSLSGLSKPIWLQLRNLLRNVFLATVSANITCIFKLVAPHHWITGRADEGFESDMNHLYNYVGELLQTQVFGLRSELLYYFKWSYCSCFRLCCRSRFCTACCILKSQIICYLASCLALSALCSLTMERRASPRTAAIIMATVLWPQCDAAVTGGIWRLDTTSAGLF